VEDGGIAEMLTTPGSIRTLQRKLYRKAKQEPACRFHALYDNVYRADILGHAYNLVRAIKVVLVLTASSLGTSRLWKGYPHS